MNKAIMTYDAVTGMPLGTPLRAGGTTFVQGFVAGGCLSAFQDRSTQLGSSADLKRVLRHALQGGTALAAGTQTASALRQRNYVSALVAAATGAAGVLIIERLLSDNVHVEQEKQHG